MPFVALLILGFVTGCLLQRWLKRFWVSVIVPCALFAGAVAADALIVRQRSAGSEFWPIALLVGCPVVALGALCGAMTVGRLLRPG